MCIIRGEIIIGKFGKISFVVVSFEFSKFLAKEVVFLLVSIIGPILT